MPSETDDPYRTQSQSEFFATAEYLHDIFDAIVDPIIVRDLNYNIVLASRIAEEFYGKYVVGSECYQAQRDNNSPSRDCPANQTVETRQPIMREVIDKRADDTLLINTYPPVQRTRQIKRRGKRARYQPYKKGRPGDTSSVSEAEIELLNGEGLLVGAFPHEHFAGGALK